MKYIIQPITDITAFLIKGIYDFLAGFGIESMILTLLLLAIFSRVLSAAVTGIAKFVSKFTKKKVIKKTLMIISIVISVILALGVYWVVKDIGHYIPALKDSLFLSKSPLTLYREDKGKLVYYAGFVGIELFYTLFNSFIYPKVAGIKKSMGGRAFNFYIFGSICLASIGLPLVFSIYWAFTAILSMVINTVKLLFRKNKQATRNTPVPEGQGDNPRQSNITDNKLYKKALKSMELSKKQEAKIDKFFGKPGSAAEKDLAIETPDIETIDAK